MSFCAVSSGVVVSPSSDHIVAFNNPAKGTAVARHSSPLVSLTGTSGSKIENAISRTHANGISPSATNYAARQYSGYASHDALLSHSAKYFDGIADRRFLAGRYLN